MSDHEFIDLTDEQAAEIAAKFNMTVEAVRAEFEATKAQGLDSVMAELDVRVGEIEDLVQDVADDVANRFLGRPDRLRAMGEFYSEGWDALNVEEITNATVGDLFFNMAVAIYKLAEAQARIDALLDGGHRAGK